jgi:hypothetical protein
MTKSLYDDRETVGTIALKAAQGTERPEAGDLARELVKSYVKDLNNCIKSKPYGERSFYITVSEKKDMQLKNVLRRILTHSLIRPYPEDNTDVFWTCPKQCQTKYCWSLPHISVMDEYLRHPERHPKEQIADIKAYKAERLEYFGFIYLYDNPDGSAFYMPNPLHKDRPLVNKSKRK